MKKLLVMWVFAGAIGSLTGQSLPERDSLLSLLPGAKEDSNAVHLYINIGEQYADNEPAKAKYYFKKAGELSKKINYTKGIIDYHAGYVYVLNHEGLFDSSILLNLQAMALARKLGDSVYVAKTAINTGIAYDANGEYENAVNYYEEGKKLFEKLNNADYEAQIDDILQLHFFNIRQYNRAIEYGEKAVSISRKINNTAILGRSLNNLGLSYLAKKDIDKAARAFTEALEVSFAIKDKNLELNEYLNLGEVFLYHDEYEKMKPYVEKALHLATELGFYEKEMIAKNMLSSYYQYKHNFVEAEKLAKEALAVSYKYDLRPTRVSTFTQLSNIAFAMKNIKLGKFYSNEADLLDDSLLNETVQKNTIDIEKKYETQKKETQINQLEAEKKVQQFYIKQKDILNYILIGGTLAVLTISLLAYRTYRQKQKLQQQRISELETQQQLTATEAVLKGEEQERTRLAKDLHDGLGGMLSGIKYSLHTMKGNLIMTPENNQAFERSMDMLDSSIKEMRRVAHNMMPEALVKFGLDTALKDFCNEINQTGAIPITYQSIGLENAAIDQTISITIYRIVQELINNTIKHAAARNAIVQLSKTGERLSITVEDDGKGFDTAILKQSKGIGWSNIQNRIEFLKGKLDVHSQPGKGTSVMFDLPV